MDSPLKCVALVLASLCLTEALEAQTLMRATDDGKTRVSVFIDGNVKSVFGEGAETANAAGTLGIRRSGEHALLSARINVAASADTVRDDFGASMLAPAGGSALNSGLIDFTIENLIAKERDADGRRSPLNRLGVTGYFSVATHRWATDQPASSLDDPPGLAAFDVPILGAALGLAYPFVRGTIGTEDPKAVQIRAHAAFSNRWLLGDLASDAMDGLRSTLLGTDARWFPGVEIGLGLQFDTINADLVFHWFGRDVPGLSNGQVAAGVGISADLISGVLNASE